MTNNTTIVFLHPHFLKQGGASTVVLEQAYRLQKKGVNCLIVTTKINPDVIRSYPHLKIIELKGLTTGNLFFWLTFPIWYFKIQKILNAIPHEIIFCHSLSIYWGYWYKKIHPHTPLVYYLHDLGLPYTDQAIEIKGLTLLQQLFMNFMTPILGLFNKDIFKSADYIIANSHTSSSYLSNHYKCTANAVIYPGINRKIFKPSSKKLDYVYTVGRLEKLKNIDQIIHGFSHYHRMNPASKTSLFIIGEGNEKTHLIKLVCSYNMGTHIKFLGRKNNQEISAIASRAKIGIFLSPYESFGITVMESLASGTPVIGINKNGIKELIKTNKIGILVDGSTLSISNAINKLMKNPVLLSTMSKNASIYASRFDWDTHIKKLHSFFMNM